MQGEKWYDYIMNTKENSEVYGGVENIDICVIARENRESLEEALYSIAEYYKGACIIIGDVAMEHNRAYYKQLRIELAEFGLMNRVIVHHLPWNTSDAEARNFLMANTNAKYKVFVTEDMRFTPETTLEVMAYVMDQNQVIGMTVGAIDETVAPGDGSTIEVGAEKIVVEKTKSCTPFFMVRRELKNYVRWVDTKDTDADFASKMGSAPYQLVTMPSVVIHKETIDENRNKEEGGGDGKATERTVQGGDGDGAGGDLLRSGKDDASKSTAPRGRQSGGGAGPVPGESDK